MNVNPLITKDYRKKDDFAVPKNKPNTNPIKPNLVRLRRIQKAHLCLPATPFGGFSAVNSFRPGFGEQYYLFADASADVRQRESYWDRFSELKICAYTFRKIVA